MGVNHPSMEASDLTTVGKFMPHATSPKKKSQVKSVGGDGRKGRSHGNDRKNSGTKYRVSDSREEGE
jgi:hypothetical protein